MVDESVGVDSQGKGFSDRDAQQGSPRRPFRGARVAWSKPAILDMRTTGGALTRVRSCQGRPGRVRTGAGRAWLPWEVTGKGSNWEITALCPDQTAGEGRRGTPDPFLNGTLGANMRTGSEGGRGHWLVLKNKQDPGHDLQRLGRKGRRGRLSWWWAE